MTQDKHPNPGQAPVVPDNAMIERACRQRWPEWDEIGPGGRKARAEEVRAMLKAAFNIQDDSNQAGRPEKDDATGMAGHNEDASDKGQEQPLLLAGGMTEQDVIDQFDFLEGLAYPSTYMAIARKTMDLMREPPVLISHAGGEHKDTPPIRTDVIQIAKELGFLEDLLNPHTLDEVTDKVVELVDSSVAVTLKG